MRKQVFLNARVSIAQTIVVGLVLFILYRYLLATIGVEQLGLWSVVLASTSISRISELGLSGSVVKFGILIAGLIIISYPFLKWLLEYILPSNAIFVALLLFPYALVSLWITAVAGIFISGLDGCHRIDLRGFLMIAANIVYLLLTVMLVPYHGIMGLAYAQVIQASILLLASWFLLRYVLPDLPFLPHKFSRSLFREMITYGINFQIASIMMMLFEPVTKALLSKFGNLSMVGYYEMANRMVIQFRALIVSTNQVIVPAIANLHETAPGKLQGIYKDSCRLILYIAIPFYGVIAALIPVISELWIGHYESLFLTFACLLIFGCFFNTMAGPAYFDNLGRGRLRWNTISHVTMGGMNLILGYYLGSQFGGIGVVVAWVFSLVFGSCIVVIAYHSDSEISLSNLFPDENRWLFTATSMSIILVWTAYHYLYDYNESIVILLLCLCLSFMLVLISLWYHPMRARIQSWLP